MTSRIEPLATPGLPVVELETAYDVLAEAIDRVEPKRRELFLAKLALLNANAMGDVALFCQHIESAVQDL